MLINQVYGYWGAVYADTLLYKLVGVSFLPWIYMFLLGAVSEELAFTLWNSIWSLLYSMCGLFMYSYVFGKCVRVEAR